MDRFIDFADRLSAWFGKAFAWAIMVMTIGVGYEVVVRRLFGAPTSWAFDVSDIMDGTLFMMGGAYTLSRNGHVRGDFIYRLWKPRTQALVEFVLYFIFFFPGVMALMVIGWKYAAQVLELWRGERQQSGGHTDFQLKSVIAAAGILLFIQGSPRSCAASSACARGYWSFAPGRHRGDRGQADAG